MLTLTLALLLAACAPGDETGAVDGRTDGGACVYEDGGSGVWRGAELGGYPLVLLVSPDPYHRGPTDAWWVDDEGILVSCGSTPGLSVEVRWVK